MNTWRTLSAPLHAEFAITSTCQMSCNYCSAAPFTGHHADPDRLIELISELGGLGVFSILLSGGEPTLHPRFLDIVAEAARSIPEVTLNTNGIRFARRSYAERFHEICPKVVVGVSLDAVDPIVNDKHRGTGGRQAIQAIDNLSELRHPVAISTVLIDDNVSEAETIIERFYPSVKAFRFFPRVPRSLREQELNNSSYWHDVDNLYRRVSELSSRRPDLKIAMPYSQIGPDKQHPLYTNIPGCNCVYSKAFVDSQLDIYPCYYSANADTCYGNGAFQSFTTVWNSEKANELRRKTDTSLCGVKSHRPSVPHKYAPNSVHIEN